MTDNHRVGHLMIRFYEKKSGEAKKLSKKLFYLRKALRINMQIVKQLNLEILK